MKIMVVPVFLSYLPLKKGDVVSIIGSGGKTTLMFHLAQELVKKGTLVITTTTTKIFPPLPSESPQLLISENEEFLLNKTQEFFKKGKHLTLAEKCIGAKLKGLTPELVDKIRAHGIGDVILVEADGARNRPLKAPNETEPVIPPSTTWILVVVGLDGIGEKNTEANVFRPEYFSRLGGIKVGSTITPESVSRLILLPDGLTRGTPEKARIIVILNKGEITGSLERGREIAGLLMQAQKKSIKKVLITSLIPVPQVFEIVNLTSEETA